MGILSGLSDLGLGKLEGADLYEKEEKPVEKKEPVVAPQVQTAKETDFIFEKTYECVVCGKSFKESTVKTGRARLIKQDPDLRPVFNGIDTIKYDVISCPYCGYSALSKYYGSIAAPQAKLIKENISKNFIKFPRNMVVSYDEAIDRFRLALANSIVKKAKDSEKAYICLRMAWVIRGKRENLDPNTEGYDDVRAELIDDEAELLHNALDGFVSARQSETFPIAGMDEITLDYLLSVLFVKEGDIDNASKLVGKILASKSANNRMKERARELKELILARKKQ